MKKIFITNILTLFIIGLFAFSVTSVLAQPGGTPGGNPGGTPGGTSVTTGGDVSFGNPLGDGVTYQTVVAKVIKGVLGIVGVAALVIFIYGGITWMTSLGNAERVKRGRDTLIWGTLGLVVVFASFAVVNLILSALDAT